MIQNLIRISVRHLWRDRFFTALNISGLALGLTAAVFMFLWVRDELSFDTMYADHDRIYRVLTNWKFGENREWAAATPAPLKEEAAESVPGAEYMARTYNLGDETFHIGPNRVSLEKVLLAENGYLSIFQLPFIAGNSETALSEPGNIVLTEKAAISLFGSIPPLGTHLKHEKGAEYTVAGILKNHPTNSSLQFDALIPWEGNIMNFIRNPKQALNWGQINYGYWIKLREQTNAAEIAGKLSGIAAKYRSGDEGFYFGLQKVTDIHLYSDFLRWNKGGDVMTIRLVALIGFLLLLIACINYVNLTTARAQSRARSVGIRQTIGAGKVHLFGQAMAESALTVVTAMGLSLLLFFLFLPGFESLGGKDFTREQIFSPGSLTLFLGSGLAAWIFSGIQPALQITRFKPVTAMKGDAPRGSKGWTRQMLVVGQFVFSIGLGICSLLIYKQLEYVRESSLGFDREQTFSAFLPGKALLLKSELEGKPGVHGVCLSDNPFIDLGSQCSGDEWEGSQPDQPSDLWQINVDSDFPAMFNLQLTDGRWFRPGNADSLSFVINESAAKMMNLQNPVGKWIKHGGVKGTIAGVAKDFHFQSLRNQIEPMIFSQDPDWFYVMYVKTSGADAAKAIASTQATFQKLFPDKVFKYEFLDDQYDQLYKSEARAGNITGLFTGLSFIISCLGLFGLAAFAAVRRTKEIGIRKVLGASVAGIMTMLSRDFMLLIFIAFVIAAPLAYYFMQQWLANFAYHITMPWWIFSFTAAVAMGIALLTISFQSLKAALANPVKTLRND